RGGERRRSSTTCPPVPYHPAMEERLDELEQRYADHSSLLADPATIAAPARLREISREHSHLTQLVEAGARWRRLRDEERDARSMLHEEGLESELVEMARAELERLRPQLAEQEEKLKLLLIPRDPLDDRDAVVEVRAGTGGDEAA